MWRGLKVCQIVHKVVNRPEILVTTTIVEITAKIKKYSNRKKNNQNEQHSNAPQTEITVAMFHRLLPNGDCYQFFIGLFMWTFTSASVRWFMFAIDLNEFSFGFCWHECEVIIQMFQIYCCMFVIHLAQQKRIKAVSESSSRVDFWIIWKGSEWWTFL